jgi:FixJ family two-component response regulator
MSTGSLICVIDDDESMRESLLGFFRSAGFHAESFASAEQFLASDSLLHAGCLVLDVAMPAMSGPELQLYLKRRAIAIPIVFITGRFDEKARSRVVQEGAVAYLVTPFSADDLLNAVSAALRSNLHDPRLS